MANLRLTLGAVFGAVTGAADAVTNTLNAANTGVGMLSRYVSDAAEHQTVRAKYDNKVFAATVKQEKAKELTVSRLEIKQFISQSQDHAELYEAAFNELDDAPTPGAYGVRAAA